MGSCASKDVKVSTENKATNKKPTTGKSRLGAAEEKLLKDTVERDNSISAREAAARAAENRYKAKTDKDKESSERLKAMKLMSKSEKGLQ